METSCHRDKLEKLKVKLGYGGLFVVEKVDRTGGLALFWKPNYKVQLLKFQKNFIDVAVGNAEGEEWLITSFYRFPESVRRRDSWNLLRSLALSSSMPWIFFSDFNDLLHPSEKRGKHVHPNWKLHGFRTLFRIRVSSIWAWLVINLHGSAQQVLRIGLRSGWIVP